MGDTDAVLVWHNTVVQWHLDQPVPLECGCDDDTPDDQYCATSVAYADRHVAASPELDGPPDPWSYDTWVAAWGKNATLIADDRDYRMPAVPKQMMWLVTRFLVGGRTAVELTLCQVGEEALTVLQRARVAAQPTLVAACARRMLADLTG